MTDFELCDSYLCCPVCGQGSRPFAGQMRRNSGAMRQMIVDLFHHRRICLSCGVNFKVLRFNPLGPSRYLPKSWIRHSRTKIYGRRFPELNSSRSNFFESENVPEYDIHPPLIPIKNTALVAVPNPPANLELVPAALLIELNSKKVGLHLHLKLDADASADFARSALELVAKSAKAIGGLAQQILRDVYQCGKQDSEIVRPSQDHESEGVVGENSSPTLR